jgi:integrase
MKNAKPARPYPEFPLFAHSNGQWCKKIKQKQWFFGVWSDADSALRKYLDEVDEIQAGRDPRRSGVVQVSLDELSVADLCNLYLERQQQRATDGEITQRHFSDGLKSCELVINHFGKFMRAAALRSADFKDLKNSMPSTWGPVKIGNEIQRIRAVFKWGYETELLTVMPNFGPDFKKPSRTITRRDKQQRQMKRGGKLDFAAAEVKTLIDSSTGWLKACILLGVNGGMGNADCGQLSTTFLDLKSGWHDLPRQKTGIERKFRLWPETVEAIRQAMTTRPLPKNGSHDPYCFLTSHGMPVWWETTKDTGKTFVCDNISKRFTKLTASSGLKRDGRGFYSLRRTFETVAGGAKDQPAVDAVMGHADESMAAVYRQGVSDERLIDVANYVHKWLFGK